MATKLTSNKEIDAAVKKLLAEPTAEGSEDLREALKVAITWEKVKAGLNEQSAGSGWDDEPEK